MAKRSSKPKRPTTQKYLDIGQVRDDVIVLKDGTLRAVILVSSINFALKSADEQQGIVQAYMQFLNGLESPVQVVIQSRKMNIDEYVGRMKTAQRELKNELLRTQMEDYVAFVKDLVEGGEIMSKRFYVVVPYDPERNPKKGFFSRFKETISPNIRINLSEKQFQLRLHHLEQQVSHVIGGLNSMSVAGVRLDTQGLIELLYNAYNPVLSSTQTLGSVDDLQVETSYGF